jgi:hypothetical protein
MSHPHSATSAGSCPLMWYELCFISGDDVVDCSSITAWVCVSAQMAMEACEDRCRWFARSLVEGAVLKRLKRFKPVCQASLITLKAPQRRVANLMSALTSVSPKLDTRAALVATCRSNPKVARAVIDALLPWYESSQHDAIRTIWGQACQPLSK